jgi:drug/metabolite transporter (DMT)-like permease
MGSQCIEVAGKRIGADTVNMIRLLMALILFCTTQFITTGQLIPITFPLEAWGWLALSGVIGVTFGDMFLVKAFVDIGPRISMLIMSLAAPLTAIVGWIFLDEVYELHQWLGMLITLSGVSWVILEKNNGVTTKKAEIKKRWIRQLPSKGVIFGFLAMTGQAIGYIFSKVGMQTEGGYLEPFASTQIRFIAGTIGFIVIFTFIRSWSAFFDAFRNKKAIGFTTAGSVLGPYLGVSLSLFALHFISTGVASTILSLVPIFLIPFAVFLHKEHVSYRGILGAVMAIGGVILLIYRPL